MVTSNQEHRTSKPVGAGTDTSMIKPRPAIHETPAPRRETPTATPPTRFAEVIGPDGNPMTWDDLPPADTRRWVARRKAQVVAGVRAGFITLEEACARYALSVDEFLSWQRLFDRHGLSGLRTTRTKHYRRTTDSPAS